jgi:hypothetical protein
MFKPPHLILPAPGPGWEIWSPGPGGMIKGGWFEEPAAAAASVKKAVLALPARWCRTLAFSAPPADAKQARALAFTQLEKRGLATGSADQTSFSCQFFPMPGGSNLLIVDTLTPMGLSAVGALKIHGIIPAARLYSLPEQRLRIHREAGRMVLTAAWQGHAAHVQNLTAANHDAPALAAEISLTLMTLRQQGLLPPPTGIDWSAPLTDSEHAVVENALGLPVTVHTLPPPVPGPLAPSLQPAGVREARARRRSQLLRGAAAAALPVAGFLWWQQQRQQLIALETEAARLQEAVTSTAGANAESRAGTEQMRQTQQRWQGLRTALEPKRYPLIQLNQLTRCLGDAGIVLTRFETRGPDISVSGTAQSAGEAYQYFTTVAAEPELKICAWSMAEPGLRNDGTAQFELKGKMR